MSAARQLLLGSYAARWVVLPPLTGVAMLAQSTRPISSLA